MSRWSSRIGSQASEASPPSGMYGRPSDPIYDFEGLAGSWDDIGMVSIFGSGPVQVLFISSIMTYSPALGSGSDIILLRAVAIRVSP